MVSRCVSRSRFFFKKKLLFLFWCAGRFFGVIPYFDILEERVITHVCDGARLQLVGDSQLVAACPDTLWGLINSCWCEFPRGRPTFSEVVTTLGSMSTQIAQPRAEALLAEERLEREKLSREKTDLEAQLALVKLEKRQDEPLRVLV